ncbi:Uncharacterized conserved protein [Ectothiorhodospira magna]|uniref:Uncharacterized conserved protein n=1 Tax=Ectothiorhodospira magna TaxID=867345 RepID=A0A1H9A223_9GAMM|nr:6-hydroxymethylpterin diphosphokinase MptE-like protein [Ectothiorhodospira magna]SEP70776.1 Uncharacterized conserved protein [Ectothiorhodospira magna]
MVSMESIFEKNIAAINKRNPNFLKKIDLDEISDDLFSVEGKRGALTLKARDSSGEYYLHSPYDPVREMNQLIDREFSSEEKIFKEARFFIVMGIGLGYCLDALLPRLKKGQKVILVEPRDSDFIFALKTRDFSEFIENDAISIVVQKDPGVAAAHVSHLICSTIQRSWKLLLHPVMMRRNFDFSKQFVLKLRGNLFGIMTGMNTEIGLSHLFASNVIENIPDIVRSPGVNSFINAWRDKPVIVIAAGPSLDKQIPLLKKYNDKILMISVGAAWRNLSSEGVQPHILAAVDPQDISQTAFNGLECKGNWLLADTATNRGVVGGFKGKKIFSNSYEKLEGFLTHVCEKKGVLGSGGSVAHITFNFALKMGANPIIMVGQDLAYTDNLTHTKGHVHRKVVTVDDEAFEVPGYYGGKLKTSIQMDTFRIYFEDLIKIHPESRVINATEGGAKIEGTEQMPLAEVMEKFAGDDVIDIENLWPSNHHFSQNTEQAIDYINEIIEKIKSAKVLANDILDSSERLKVALDETDSEKSSAAIDMEKFLLKDLYAQFREVDESAIWLIESFTASARYGVLRSMDERDDKLDVEEGDEEKEMDDAKSEGIKNIDLNSEFYRNIATACDAVVPALEKTIEKINNF